MEKIIICSECNEKPVFVKKRGLCKFCYGKFQKFSGHIIDKKTHQYSKYYAIKTIGNAREVEFVKNFFNHKNWIHNPAIFYLSDGKYTPDFYDGERNVFIEVAGSRQAYCSNKHKYELLRKTFPKLKFEIRKVDGTILNEDSHHKDW